MCSQSQWRTGSSLLFFDPSLIWFHVCDVNYYFLLLGDVADTRHAANSVQNDSMSFLEKVILTFFMFILFGTGSIRRLGTSVFTFNVCFCVQLRNLGAGLVFRTLNPLVPTFCLVVLVTYGLCDKLRNFVFGIFVPQYHYPYSVALSFGQVGA